MSCILRSALVVTCTLGLLAGCSSKSTEMNKVAGQTSTESPDAVRVLVKDKVQQIAEATLKEDYEVVVDLTYPRVVEILGGRQKMIETIKTLMGQMKSEGLSLQSAKVGEPGDFYSAEGNTFVLVPVDMIMKIPDGKVVGKSFQLGISSDGMKTWKFIGSETFHDNKALFKQLRIKLPSDMKIPEEQEPEVTLDSGKVVQLNSEEAEMAKIVKKKVQESNQAFFDGKYEVVLDGMYPKMVELLGGRKKLIETMKKAMTEAKGMSCLSYETGEPEFFSNERTSFVIVPTKAVLKVSRGRAISRSFELGISEDNKKSWFFIHGTKLNQATIKELGLRLPPEMKLPEIPKLETIPD